MPKKSMWLFDIMTCTGITLLKMARAHVLYRYIISLQNVHLDVTTHFQTLSHECRDVSSLKMKRGGWIIPCMDVQTLLDRLTCFDDCDMLPGGSTAMRPPPCNRLSLSKHGNMQAYWHFYSTVGMNYKPQKSCMAPLFRTGIIIPVSILV